MPTKEQRQTYRKVGKRSLCRGKRIVKPNRCAKLKTCKIARGPKLAYCRKKRSTRYSKRPRKY